MEALDDKKNCVSGSDNEPENSKPNSTLSGQKTINTNIKNPDIWNFENYVKKAIEFILIYDKSTSSFLQRSLDISYVKADCIIEILKDRGFLDIDE